jgi:predicted ArsR family transcriptional regulator
MKPLISIVESLTGSTVGGSMPGGRLGKLQGVLVRRGWAPKQAHFLALLLVDGPSSTAEVARSTGASPLHVRRMYHALHREGWVDAEELHRKPRGRRMMQYHLRDPQAFRAHLMGGLEADLGFLRSMGLP